MLRYIMLYCLYYIMVYCIISRAGHVRERCCEGRDGVTAAAVDVRTQEAIEVQL